MEDLSKYHKLVGDLFKSSTSDEEWQSYKINPEQVEFFKEHGYLKDIKLLEDWQVDVLNNDLAAIADPEHPGHDLFYEFNSNESDDPNAVLFHSLGHWRITKAFHDVIFNPRFTMVASQLLNDRDVRFWHDQLFCKPAKHGGVVAWHQDYSYWTRTTPMQHLTCWVALDDANEENGCMHYISGSHRWGLLEKPELAGEMNGIHEFLDDDQKAAFKESIAVKMPKGYASFHHPLMVHGSFENKSENSRRAFVLNVFADGTLSNSNEEVLKGVPKILKGEKMNGQFFPRVIERGTIDENLPPLKKQVPVK